MMSASLRLTITTPGEVLLDAGDLRSIRAEDESGGFGLLPGCADLLTVLRASVVRWRTSDGAEHFCAIRGGVMTAKGGARVAIACRRGALGDDLQKLEAEVCAARAALAAAATSARVEQTRLHASAVRQLIRYLRPAGISASIFGDGDGEASGATLLRATRWRAPRAKPRSATRCAANTRSRRSARALAKSACLAG